MTCFRFKYGTSLLKMCKKTGVCYHAVYQRIEKGMSLEEAFKDAQRNKGNKRGNTKNFVNGKTLIDFLNGDRKLYYAVLRRTRKGIPLNTALKMVGVKI